MFDKNEIILKLTEFRKEKYDKIANISDNCYNLSLNLINYLIFEPDAYITQRKTVQLEYENNLNYLEIEIFDDCYHIFSKMGDGEEIDKTFNEKELYEVINIIKIFNKGKPVKPVLFTGAFNPPTIAHKGMIDSAFKYGFDYVIFAIANSEFLEKKQKKNNDFSFSEEDRLNMILAMTYKYSNVLIFGVEKGYTYNVLCDVSEKYNIKSLFFAMGSDKLSEISRWGHNEKLLKEFKFYVLARGKDDYIKVKNNCCDIFQNTEFVLGEDSQEHKDISATEVRKNIRNNKEYENLVDENVFNYLKKLNN